MAADCCAACMRITILQTDISWGQRESNAREAERLMAEAPGSQLYVLPEMWSTGFATDPTGMAEGDGWSLAWMRRMAEHTEAAICGSVAVQTCEEGREEYRNRLYFVKPDGSVAFYDKRHLFGYGGEQLHYTAGQTRTVVEYGGIRWLMLVCYYLRFPVWSRYRGDYDGIIYVANWPVPRIAVWDTLLKARALENQAVVVGANRVGQDPSCDYCGHSAVIDAKGRLLAEERTGAVTAVSAEVDAADIVSFRSKFRVLDDRD